MSPRTKYGASPVKRVRLTAAEIAVVKAALHDILAAEHPATIRSVFYQAVSRGTVAKTENAYKRVGEYLGQMRDNGAVPFGWIADNTRWMRKPVTYDGLTDALEAVASFYRRDLWTFADNYVEVWSEKDALAGTLMPVTEKWDVPLMVTRGYPSTTFVYGAAEAIAHKAKPTTIYYLGDHDPSGVDIPVSTEAKLRRYAPDVDLDFVRLAVNVDQIELLGLMTRPTKVSDSRSRNFVGESVEVDAIPPTLLRAMVDDAIRGHVDADLLAHLEAVEEAERDTLNDLARAMAGAQ